MGISLNQASGPRSPVVRFSKLGDTFIGCVVNIEQRERLDRDRLPVMKPNGQPAKELVVTCHAMPGTTSPAGPIDSQKIPEPGDEVRFILRGQGWSQWIDAARQLGGEQVGDIVTHTATHAIAYDQHGTPTGEMRDQSEVDAVPRNRTVGIYGALTLRRATPAEQPLVAAAEAAYQQATSTWPAGQSHAAPVDIDDVA